MQAFFHLIPFIAKALAASCKRHGVKKMVTDIGKDVVKDKAKEIVEKGMKKKEQREKNGN